MSIWEKAVVDAVLRRQWLNQILSWCIRGSVNKVVYSRDEVISFVVDDILANKDMRESIPEASIVLQMLKDDVTAKEIEVYLRKALK